MTDLKEQFLLRRVRAFRDEQAFAELYREHAPGLVRYLTSKLPSYQEAQDAASVTFTRVWSYIRTTEVESFSGLLYTIARGVVADFYRSLERKGEEELFERGHEDGSQEEEIVVRGEVALVRKALGQLRADHRTVIILRYMEQLPVREVARRMERTQSNTRVLTHRALKHLREILASYDGKGPDQPAGKNEGRA